LNLNPIDRNFLIIIPAISGLVKYLSPGCSLSLGLYTSNIKGNVIPDKTAYAVTATIPLSVLPKFPMYCRFTHEDIASACCTTRVTITRLMGILEQIGLISFDSKNHIILKN
jgi:CRP-like cAMP-binding protein